MNNYLPLSRTTDILEQNLLNEVLIYDLAENRAFSLNPSLSVVWHLCDGKRTVAEIAKVAGKKLGSQVTKDFVWVSLDLFKQNNLLADPEFHLSRMTGVSRRQMLERVALATAIALPAIIPIFVPTAALAVSGCAALGQGCGGFNPPFCCPGLNCQPPTTLGGQGVCF